MTSQTIDLQLPMQPTTACSRDQFACCIGVAVVFLFCPLSSAETPLRDASFADGGCGAPIIVAMAEPATFPNHAKSKAADLSPSRPIPTAMRTLFNESACSISLTTWRALLNDPATQLAALPMVVDVRSTEARVTRPLSKDANIVAMPMNSVAHARLTQSRPVLLISESSTQAEATRACIALRERGNANAFVLAAGERAWFVREELAGSTATVSAPGHPRAFVGAQLGRLDAGAAARMLDDEATETIEGDMPNLSERLARRLPDHKSQRLILFSPASANVMPQMMDQRMANAPLDTWWSLATRADLDAVRAQSRTTALAANAPLVRPCGVQ